MNSSITYLQQSTIKKNKDFRKNSHRLEGDNRNPYRTFLGLGEVSRIISQTYYDAGFLARIIR